MTIRTIPLLFAGLAFAVTTSWTFGQDVFGDVNQDGDVDRQDFSVMARCIAGPMATPTGLRCPAFDEQADGDVDLADYRAFQTTFGAAPSTFVGPLFEGAVALVGFGSGQIDVGDFDDDGDLDILKGNDRDASLLLNEGHGAFARETRIPTELPLPGFQVADDLDGDGDLDAAFSGYHPNRDLRVALNGGAGSFVLAPIISFPGGVSFLASIDVDADGDKDLVLNIFVEDSGTLAVMFNDGLGGFTGPVMTAPTQRTSPFVSGDFDGDGDVDVLGLDDASDRFRLFTNLGTGEFADSIAGVVLLDDYTSRLLLAGDLDGDADLDALVSVWGDTTYSAYANDGTGVLSFHGTVDATMQYISPRRMIDVDSDGDVDILAVQRPEGPAVFLNDGAAGFSPPTFFGPVDRSSSLATGDLDGDGDADLAMGIRGGLGCEGDDQGLVTVLLNDGSGSFDRRPVTHSDTFFLSTLITIADIDADGVPDAIGDGGSLAGASVDIWFGQLGGQFERGSSFDSQSGRTAVADFDGDSDVDVLYYQFGEYMPGPRRNEGSGLVLARNLGGRNFAAPERVSDDLALSRILPVDLDGDQDVDLVATAGSTDWSSHAAVYLFMNNGSGDFTTAVPLATEFPYASQARAADLDHDGDQDLLFVTAESYAVAMNEGDGSFGPTRFLSVELGELALSIADVDGDQLPDLVLLSNVAGELRVHRGIGDGTFLAPAVYPAPIEDSLWSSAVALADLDVDGDLDVYFAFPGDFDCETSSYTVVMLNDGAGGFAAVAEYLGGQAMHRSVGVGDFDLDGDLDLVASDFEFGSLIVSRNRVIP